MKLTLNANVLRIILFATIVLLVTGAVTGFIFAQKKLQEYASSINQTEADAAAGDGNIAALQQLGETLKTTQDIKAKADSIAVPMSQYPVGVIQNITSIANKAGLKITSISYGDANDPSAATPQTAPTPTTTPITPGTTPATGTLDTTASGATKKTINVTTESPVSYDALMSFLKGIETDDMYMHITKVSLTKATGNSITTQPFTIEVYVR